MAFRRVEKINVSDLVDLQAYTAQTARQALAQEQRRGFPKTGYLKLVDNKENVPEENVKLYGKIIYLAPVQLLNIAIEAWEEVINRSPVGKGAAADRTGRYWQNNAIIFNNKVLTSIDELERELNRDTPRDFTKDQILIINTQPYAAKIEKGHSVQAPKGVFKGVANLMRRKYGKQAFISFRWQRWQTAYKITRKGKYRRTQAKSRGGTLGFPSIRIRPGRQARKGFNNV